MKNVKNCLNCYHCTEAQDCKHCFFLKDNIKDCQDCSYFGLNQTNCYQCSSSGHDAYNLRFCIDCYQSHDLTYCLHCPSASESFGSFGLKNNAKNCILNKSYTTQEYQTLENKIVQHMKETGEWGQFFPSTMTPFAYNETEAQEYFPLTKEEALERGYQWREKKELSPDSQGVRTGDSTPVPDNITQVPDTITDQVLYCKSSGKPYKIQKAELEFYRKMNLPIPRFHPDIRHLERMALRNPRKLWDRACSDCQKEIQTTYAPQRPEKILCEDCYLNLVH